MDKLEGKTSDKRVEKYTGLIQTIRDSGRLDTRYKGQEYVIGVIRGLLEVVYNVEYEYNFAGGMTRAKENSFLKELAYERGVSE